MKDVDKSFLMFFGMLFSTIIIVVGIVCAHNNSKVNKLVNLYKECVVTQKTSATVDYNCAYLIR